MTDQLPPSLPPLKITIVTGPWLPTPPGAAGAVERIWSDLAKQFAQRGHDVTVLSRSAPGLPKQDVSDGVKIIRLTRFKQGKNIYLDLMKDALYSLRMLTQLPKADIMVTNTFWLPIFAPMFKSKAGRICIQVQRMPKGQIKLYRKCDRLSAVSQAISDMIMQECPDIGPKVKLIPNPIDLRYFYPPSNRTLVTTPGKPRIIAYTGRIHPEKGLHLLVAAFIRLKKEFDDLSLRIIGPWTVERGGGGQKYVDKLKSLAGSTPIILDEPIYDRVKLADSLRNATYYCYPSLAEKGESFGVAPLEAMATGIAPVLSGLACFNEFLTDGENGLVFNHRGIDPADELATTLRRLISDPTLASRLNARATTDARKFSYDIVADQYLTDFRQILKTPRS